MSTPPKKAVLEPLRVRIRRAQFIVGLGFLALVMGSVLSSGLRMRLMVRLEALPELLGYAVDLAVRGLWVLGVLPLLCYGAARIVDLRPWPTALGAAMTGQGFLVALEFSSNGVEGWMASGWLALALEWGVLALGVVLTQRAVVRGRADAGKQAEQAQEQAAARKDEYAEFLREAEREGERIAQREQSQSSPEQAGKSEDEPKAPAA